MRPIKRPPPPRRGPPPKSGSRPRPRSGGGGGGSGFVVVLLIAAVVLIALFTPVSEHLKDLVNELVTESDGGPTEDPDTVAIRELYQSGQYDQALSRIAQVTSANPNHADAFYYKGLVHLARAGETSDPSLPLSEEEQMSLEAFERALSVNPRHALASVGIGDLYRRRIPTTRRRRAPEGEEEDPQALAAEAYQRAVTIDPKLPEAQHHYAQFLEQTGSMPEAEAAYRAAAEAAAVVPETAPDYYLAYGRFLAGPADRLDEALAQFELAAMFRQDDASIREQMAIVYSRIGSRHLEKQEYLLAEEALTRAQSLFPDPSLPEAQQTEAALAELRSIRRR